MTMSKAEYYLDKGNNKFQNGQCQEAIEYYTQAIKIKPDYTTAYNNRGISKDNMHDYKGAIEDYRQAIKLKPDYADAYNNRGNSKDNMQDYKGAIEDYGQAIKFKPDYANAYNNRGISKKNLQDYKGAIEDYRQAIKSKPDYANAYNNRGISKDNMHDYKGAIEDYSQAIKLKPDEADVYNNRGNSKKHMQDYKGAQSDFLQALRQSPQPSPLHLFNLANLYLDMGKRDEALKRYNQGARSVLTETEANLKIKFHLSDENIQHIKSSIENFEMLKNQVQEIKQQAQRQHRTDILQQLMKINASIASACIKSTDEKADQNILSNEVKAMREQIYQMRMQLQIVKGKVSKLEAKVEQMEKRIYTEERINNMIEKIDSRKMSEFFKILYNMLINHFMAYRMLSTGFFNESVRELTTFDNIAGKVCKAQSIVQKIPIIGDLVGIPFKILNIVREEKSSRLNSVIADKINGSRLQSEAVITLYMSHLIEQLINNKPFNSKLEKSIKDEQNGFLKQVMEMFGQFKETIFRKVFGGSSSGLSYVQKVVTLYVARFTLQLYEVDGYKFSLQCKNQETFAAFFMECFEDNTEQQPSIRNHSTKEQISDSSQRAWIPDDNDRYEQMQPQSCCRRFIAVFCCCCF